MSLPKSRRFYCAPAVIVLVLLIGPAYAGPTFSIDAQGPTTGMTDGFGSGNAITEGDLLSSPVGGPPMGTPVFGPFFSPPGISIPAVSLGILPTSLGFVEVDAMSFGRDAVNPRPLTSLDLYFSVDEFAVGIYTGEGKPSVWSEGAMGTMEASADVFKDLGLPHELPLQPFPYPGTVPPGAGNKEFYDGNGVYPSGHPGYALVEPNPFTYGSTPDPGDNLDAVDVDTTFDDLGRPVFFSLDAAFTDPLEGPTSIESGTGTAVANGFVGGDVLVVTPDGGRPVLYAGAATLGLDVIGGPDSDDLDALALLDDGDGIFTPGLDLLLFSVRRGSAIVGTPDYYGIPIEEGDLLMDAFTATGGVAQVGSPPVVMIAAEWLGLATVRSGAITNFDYGDDLDALDVVPEPATLCLLAAGALMVCRRRRR